MRGSGKGGKCSRKKKRVEKERAAVFGEKEFEKAEEKKK